MIGMMVGVFGKPVADIDMTPTVLGQTTSQGSGVLAFAQASESIYPPPGGAGASADIAIWVITDANNCYIRVAADTNGGSFEDSGWYAPTNVDQGQLTAIAGAGTTVFTLGLRPDSINIYTVAQTINGDGVSLGAIGSYTNDNKVSFFSPTNSVKYGLQMDCSSQTDPPSGTDFDIGDFTVQITFRKAGYHDYTITYKLETDTDAEVG